MSDLIRSASIAAVLLLAAACTPPATPVASDPPALAAAGPATTRFDGVYQYTTTAAASNSALCNKPTPQTVDVKNGEFFDPYRNRVGSIQSDGTLNATGQVLLGQGHHIKRTFALRFSDDGTLGGDTTYYRLLGGDACVYHLQGKRQS